MIVFSKTNTLIPEQIKNISSSVFFPPCFFYMFLLEGFKIIKQFSFPCNSWDFFKPELTLQYTNIILPVCKEMLLALFKSLLFPSKNLSFDFPLSPRDAFSVLLFLLCLTPYFPPSSLRLISSSFPFFIVFCLSSYETLTCLQRKTHRAQGLMFYPLLTALYLAAVNSNQNSSSSMDFQWHALLFAQIMAPYIAFEMRVWPLLRDILKRQ